MKVSLRDMARVVYEAGRATTKNGDEQPSFDEISDDTREGVLAEVHAALDANEGDTLTLAIVTALR